MQIYLTHLTTYR